MERGFLGRTGGFAGAMNICDEEGTEHYWMEEFGWDQSSLV